MNNQPEKYREALEAWQLLKAAGATNDPFGMAVFERTLSPLEEGAIAAQAAQQLHAMMVPRALAADLYREAQPAEPAVAPGEAIILGPEVGTGRPVAIRLNVINRHVLIVGASGSGKTTTIFWLIKELLRHGIGITFSDHKGEGRRIPRAAVFRSDQEPWNMLEPVGHPETYWTGWAAEFSRAYGLRPETWTELPELLARLHPNISQ